MPTNPKLARAWLDQQEAGDRKNARVVTKVTLALPAELTDDERAELVRSFAQEVTRGRAPWLAALHHPSEAGDQRNHHAHLVIRDRDPDTGKTVCGMSDKGSVERMREAWEWHVNAALQYAGLDARVDRRSLADQGVDREPTVHVGVAGTAMQRSGRASDRAEINSGIIAGNADLEAIRQSRRETVVLEREIAAAQAKREAERREAAAKAAQEAQEAREWQRRAAEAAAAQKAAQAAHEALERQRRAAEQLTKPVQPAPQPALVQTAKATAQQDAVDLEAMRLKAKAVIERFVDENLRLRSSTPGCIRVAFNREDLKPLSPESTAAARLIRFVMTDDQSRQLADYLSQKPSTFVKVQLTKIWETIDLASSVKELLRVVTLVMDALTETVRALAGRDAPEVRKGRDQGGMER